MDDEIATISVGQSVDTHASRRQSLRASSPGALTEPGSLFDEEYYRTGCGDVPYSRSEPRWIVFFGMVADQLIRSLRPRHVLDVGCALGFLVEAFWDRGVEAQGIDVSEFAIANVRRDMARHCRVASAAEGIEGRFDLITCIEVLEHMPEEEANRAIRSMTGATETILFSSTPYDHDEPTHFNVQPTLSWLQLFLERGFSPDVDFDASFVAPHAMLLRRRAEPVTDEVLRLFAALLHQRHLTVQQSNRANELGKELRLLKEDRDRSIQELRQQVADQSERAQAAERDLAASAQTVAHLREVVEEANHVIAAVKENQEDALEQLLQVNREMAESEAHIQSRIAAVEQRSAEAWNMAASILGSRIWKILAGSGGMLLRITGRRE